MVTDSQSRGVVLAGPPGVGKTRLAAECVSATGDQCHVARAAGHQASAELPFGALAHLLPAVDHAEEAMRRDQPGSLRPFATALPVSAGGRPLGPPVRDARLPSTPSPAVVHPLCVAA